VYIYHAIVKSWKREKRKGWNVMMDVTAIKELIYENAKGNTIERTLKGMDNSQRFADGFSKVKRDVVSGMYGVWEFMYNCTPEQVISFAKTL
jgi:hypothetical protein